VGGWYWIGVAAGLGTSAGLVLAALVAPARLGVPAALVLAAAAGVAIGLVLGDWPEALAGALGGLLGAFGAAQIVLGALARGGTRVGTAVLVAGAALVAAGLSFVPVAGYLIAVGAPLLALRLRRRAGDRYAGLRVLARD
jgi:hypothetical protein